MTPKWGRVYLGIVGSGLLALSVVAMHMVLTRGRGQRQWVGVLLVMLMALISVVMLVAWRKLRSGAPGARAWAIAAFLGHLPVLGLPTVIAIVGVLTFWKPESVAAAAIGKERPVRRIEGDGTHAWVERAFAIISFAALAGCTWWWDVWAHAHRLPHYRGLAKAAQFAAAFLVTVALHEAGHVIAGWAVGMKVVHFAVGPFVWKIRNGRFVFAFEPARVLHGAAGMAPRDHHLSGSWPLRQHAIMTAGGPAASIVLAALSAGVALWSPGTRYEGAWFFLATVASFSCIGGPFNLVPAKAGPMYTDGALLYQFLTDGPMARVHLAMSMVSSSVTTPLRPRDWDLETLTRAAAVMDHGRQGMLLRLYACLHHVDSDRHGEARRQYEATASLHGDALPEGKQDPALAAKMLFLGALLDGNAADARAWWHRIDSDAAKTQDLDYWRARAALHWLESDREAAAASLAKAEEFARNLPRAGAYDFDRDSLARLRMALAEGSPVR
ncbi:MAG: M50 family metallopeptidase [Bryobacteraceae bacterium]